MGLLERALRPARRRCRDLEGRHPHHRSRSGGPSRRGTALDIGVGGGAMSLPLAPRVGSIVGVDQQQDMLDVFRANAAAVGVDASTVIGAWPDVANEVEVADLVVVGHVVYNVAELEPFVRALDAHARCRVVLELTETHPLEWMRDLWMRFHGLERPTGPTADDVLAVLAELGIGARDERRTVKAPDSGAWFARREDAIHLVRKRLCLPAERDPEVAVALGSRLREIDGLWDGGERTVHGGGTRMSAPRREDRCHRHGVSGRRDATTPDRHGTELESPSATRSRCPVPARRHGDARCVRSPRRRRSATRSPREGTRRTRRNLARSSDRWRSASDAWSNDRRERAR